MDTPFKQHLGTNYIPSTEEIDQINAYLSIKEKQLAETQRSLEEITRKRDSLRESVESHRALASPARRLPSDIIQEIFLRCLPSKSDAIISSKEAPTKLTQICSAWRDIAVSLPPLWSSIQISFVKLTDPSDSVPEMTYRHYEAVQLWLQRSGSYPLSISVSSPCGHCSADVINLFARQLLSVSNRWKNIYLDVTNHILEKLEEVSPDNLCNLETLQIHPHYYDPEQNKVDISTVSKSKLWQAPNLRKIITGYSEKFLHLPLCWSQITELDFGSLDWRFCIDIDKFTPARVLWLLSQTTNLVKFNFVLDGSEDCNVTTPPVVLLRLKYFGVCMMHALHTTIFQKLQLPSLKHIKYEVHPNVAGRKVENAYPLLLLLSSTGCTVSSVESMDISDLCLNPESFKRILHLVPRLLRLFIYSCSDEANKDHNPDLCIHLLIYPSDLLQCLSPLLERLTIQGFGFSDTDILDVACTRRLRHGPLHIVHALIGSQFKDFH